MDIYCVFSCYCWHSRLFLILNSKTIHDSHMLIVVSQEENLRNWEETRVRRTTHFAREIFYTRFVSQFLFVLPRRATRSSIYTRPAMKMKKKSIFRIFPICLFMFSPNPTTSEKRNVSGKLFCAYVICVVVVVLQRVDGELIKNKCEDNSNELMR